MVLRLHLPLRLCGLILLIMDLGGEIGAQQAGDASWRSGVSRWTGSGYRTEIATAPQLTRNNTHEMTPSGLGGLSVGTGIASNEGIATDGQYDISGLASRPIPELFDSNQDFSLPAMVQSNGAELVVPDSVVKEQADSFSEQERVDTQYRDLQGTVLRIPEETEVKTDLPDGNAFGGVNLGLIEDSQSVVASPNTTGFESPDLVVADAAFSQSGESGVKVDVVSTGVNWQSAMIAFFEHRRFRPNWLDAWDSQAELGLDGSSGNANTLGIHTGFESTRSTKYFDVDLDFDYRQVRNRSTTTEDNGRITSDFDRVFNGTPHSAFGKFGAEWDRFKAFDLRLNLNGGYGYHWLRRDDFTLVTRFGAGASREIGAPNDQWLPEAVFGFESERHWTSKQKTKQKLEYFPAWEDFGNYRIVADLSWETVLDQADQMSLKLSVNNRYDSTPQGARRNDLYYSLLLLYKF